MREISEVGQFVCNSSKSARFHENGILRYAQTVTELDVSFLEQVRDEIALGMDAFDMIASMDEPTSVKQVCWTEQFLVLMSDCRIDQARVLPPDRTRKSGRTFRSILRFSLPTIYIPTRT